MRLAAALLTFIATILLADLAGWGHGWLPLLTLAGWFFVMRSLPEGGARGVVTAMLWFSVTVAALAVVQMWFMPRARGPFLSPNFLGGYAVLMFFLAAAARSSRSPGHRDCREVHPPEPGNIGAIPIRAAREIGRSLPAVANLLSLALSQSRGALLALGAGLFAMLVRRRPLWAVAGFLGATLAALALRPGIEEARWNIWRIGWLAAKQRLLLGYGQNGLWIWGMTRFYSVPLDLLLAAGLIGLAAGAWLFYEALRAARDKPAYLGFLVAWLVGGLTIFATAATMVPFFTVLGLLSRRPVAQHKAAERRHDRQIERDVEDGLEAVRLRGLAQERASGA